MQKLKRSSLNGRFSRSWSGLSASAALLLAATITSAQPVLITSPTTLGPTATTITPTAGGPAVPLGTAEITVRGTTLTMNGRFNVASLTLATGASGQPAILTHTAQATYDYSGNGSDVVRGVAINITGNLNVSAGCRIDANGRGDLGSTGLGRGDSFNSSGGGGGYGGAGGDAGGSSHSGEPGVGGVCFGFDAANIFAPRFFGSGGGNTWSGGNIVSGTGGAGGGCVSLTVGGTALIDGQILVNGTSGTAYAGAGSGGSVYLSAASLAGSGLISGNGGTGGSGCCAGTGGGGGGGRIAVVYGAGSTLDSLTVQTLGGPGNVRGGAGTVYLKPASAVRGSLIIDNNSNNGENTEFYGPLTLSTNLVVRSGGSVGPAHGQTDFNLTVNGSVTVEAGGFINADGRGMAGSSGTGRGRSADGFSGGGGAYGGAGGDAGGSSQASTIRGGVGGDCYGFDSVNLYRPALLGSGGGNTYSGGVPTSGTGGEGGGAMKLTVNGVLTVDGTVSAAGLGGTAYAGGGSGGSVWVACTTLAGGGSISADGGSGGSGCCAGTGGGGGGGRVGVYFANSTFFGSMTALGAPGNVRGGAGTVYTKRTSDARGTLTVDNNSNSGETTEFYGPVVIDANMVVRNGGRVGPAHRQTDFDLSVLGDLVLGAPSGGAPAGAIFADGRGFAGSQGPARGGAADGSSGGGAGYGGAGGRGGPGGPGGGTYGSLVMPVDLGSGGGNTYSGGFPNVGTGGFGGGRVVLAVAGAVTLGGEISARGLAGSAYAGGGSGGSIILSYGAVSGAGIVTANGGNGGTGCCATTGGGGGGGRIAIYTCSASRPTMQVAGGTGATAGSAGTTFVGSAGFIAQPGSEPVCPSATKNFVAAAVGSGPFVYTWQWQPDASGPWISVLNGVNSDPATGLPAFAATGSQTSALSIPASSSNGVIYAFRCIAINSCFSAESSVAQLIVCAADFDCSGGIDSDDTIAFFDAWDVSNSSADINRDGGVDGDDIIAFFARWDAGC